jgi:hypothetical protein
MTVKKLACNANYYYTKTMAQLHHKWCVHSILPLAPRMKQPTHVNTQNTEKLQRYLFVP